MSDERYSPFQREKLEKVLEAVNASTCVFAHKRKGSERIVFVLANGRQGVVPTLQGDPSRKIVQGWMQVSEKERVLVHYIEGFGWIPETDIHVPTFLELLKKLPGAW